MAGRRAADHADKRAAILSTAAAFFAAEGFDRASMAELARACGVSKPLIYHYFKNKEALLTAILRDHLTGLRDAVDDVPATSDADEQMHLLVTTILETYRGADAQHRLQLEAMRHLPVETVAELADLQRAIVERMRRTVASLAPNLSRAEQHAATMSIFGTLNWFYMWHRPGKGLSRTEYGTLAAQMALGGVSRLSSEA